MIFSMTGFGASKKAFYDKILSVEIKSVNSKIIDIRIRSPFNLREKENILRKEVADTALRGKIEVTVELSSANSTPLDIGDLAREQDLPAGHRERRRDRIFMLFAGIDHSLADPDRQGQGAGNGGVLHLSA